jgi:hypothetical protein
MCSLLRSEGESGDLPREATLPNAAGQAGYRLRKPSFWTTVVHRACTSDSFCIGNRERIVQFQPGRVQGGEILEVEGKLREIPNDYVWIFAGGTPPNDLLKKIGVQFGMLDLTLEASNEAKENALSRKGFAEAGAATAP